MPIDAVNDTVAVDEDDSIQIFVLTNDSDAVTILSHSFPLNGGLILLPDDSFGYVPIRNFSGTDSFTYTIEDSTGATDTATVSITVNPVNDVPVAEFDQFSVDEGATAVTLFVLNNDFDADGQGLTVTGNTLPDNGTLIDNGNGTFSYTPNVGFSGFDEFEYTIADSIGATDSATVSINVIAAGSRPVAIDDEAVTAASTQIIVPVLDNDFPGGGGLRITSVFLRGNGIASISADETAIIYTPDDGFFGFESIRYGISDVDGDMDSGRLIVQVLPANSVPDRILISELAEEAGFIIGGEQPSDRLGELVSAAGDINGDGIDDFIVAAPLSDIYGSNSGIAYVIYGTRDGFGLLDEGRRVLELDELEQFDGTKGFRIFRDEFDLIGSSVSEAGDLNGDSIDDILIATNNGGSGDNGYGESYVLFGKQGGFGALVDLDQLGPEDGFFIAGAEFGGTGNDSNGGSDSRDSVIGDVNGDDIDDIIISSPGGFFGNYGAPEGRAYVLFGTRDGFGEVAGNRRVLDLGSLNTEQGFMLSGGSDGGFFGEDRAGWSVSGAGNVNGDGFADFLVGTRNDTAYLIFGTDQGFPANIDLRDIDQDAGVILQGENLSDAGHSVSRVGDVNGDDIDDFAIGARRALVGGEQVGATYVIFGRDDEFGMEFSGQRILDLPTLTADDGFLIRGDSNYDHAGFVVAEAGDFNGDGIDDIIVGAPYGDDGAPEAGEAYIIYGTRDGFGAMIGDQRILDLTGLPADKGLVIQGDAEERATGFAVASIGDINGDGGVDVIVGGPSEDFGNIRDDGPGEAYVIFGTPAANPNTPPVATDDESEGIQDQVETASIPNLVGNDSDADGDMLTIMEVLNFQNGTAEIVGNFVEFTPNAGFVGVAGFDYIVSDGKGGTDTGHVTITFAPANAPPDAVDDSATVDEDMSVAISVLGNDSDAEGDVFSVTGNTPAANGTLTDNGGGSFSYEPDANFNGSDSFTYTITDSAGGTDTATVSITVNAVNDAPVAVNDTASVDEDSSVTIDVLSNDSDVDGNALTVLLGTGPANGSASVGAGGITYTPGANFNGSDSFTYSINDGNGGTGAATVSVTVNPVNDAPVAADDAVIATIDQPSDYAAATLLANDSDVDGDVLTVTAVGGGVNGSASLNGSTVTFTPDAGFTGAASFTYTISDGNGGTDSATVNVTVTEGNLPPTADATRSVTTLTNTALVFDISASDPDGDVLSFSASTPADGTISFDGNRATFTPTTGFMGSETITITIDDGNGGTATQAVTITTQNLPASNQFVMFTADGFTGGAGGSGTINGTDAFQQISVIDVPGSVALDPSFNKGGDVLQLSGDASAWNITRSGSSALFSDGDTFVTVPIGNIGLAVLFDDGVRELVFDGSNFAIGGQAFVTGTLSPITAAPDGTSLPGGADPAAKAVLFIAADAGIAASGVVDIFGAAGDELARLISGNLTLDASFNNGGDTIAFDEAASDYLAVRSGSSVSLTGSDTTALIPVGTAGATLTFGDGSDTRTLLLDTSIPGITIGTQQITFDPVQLIAA